MISPVAANGPITATRFTLSEKGNTPSFLRSTADFSAAILAISRFFSVSTACSSLSRSALPCGASNSPASSLFLSARSTALSTSATEILPSSISFSMQWR